MVFKRWGSKFRKISKVRKSTKRGGRKAKPSKSFAKKVQSVINKNAEDKMSYLTTGNSLVYFNSGIDSSGDVRPILPNMSNGSADNERIGDVIRAKRLNIRGYIQLDKDTAYNDASNRRIAVRLLVVQPKRYSHWSDVSTSATNWLSALIKKGGTQSYFTGQIQDLFAPVDTDAVTKMYDKVFYLSQSYTVQQVGTSTPTQIWSHDLSKTIRFFNINLRCYNKTLRYDPSASSDVLPTNYCPVLLLGYCHLDGSTPDVATTKVGICYDSTLHYQDM